MSNPFIVSLSGRKHAGKDTVARYIQSEFAKEDVRVHIMGFGTALKEVCHMLFGIPRELLYGTEEDKNTLTKLLWKNMPTQPVRTPFSSVYEYMTVREVLQYFGTEICRQMYSSVWIHACFSLIKEREEDIVALIDVRFENEAFSVKDHRGKIIRLTRAVYPNDTHASEVSLDKDRFDWSLFDLVIDNEHLNEDVTVHTAMDHVRKWWSEYKELSQ